MFSLSSQHALAKVYSHPLAQNRSLELFKLSGLTVKKENLVAPPMVIDRGFVELPSKFSPHFARWICEINPTDFRNVPSAVDNYELLFFFFFTFLSLMYSNQTMQTCPRHDVTRGSSSCASTGETSKLAVRMMFCRSSARPHEAVNPPSPGHS